VLTGSSNLLTQRGVADALPGRAEYLRLWPLAQTELRGERASLIDRLFDQNPPRLVEQTPGLVAYAEIVASGGFPDAQDRSGTRRQAYFQSYVDTLLGRDLHDVAAAQTDVAAATRLLRVLAARSSEMANFTDLARDLQITSKSARAHTELLEQVFLVQRLRPWSRNLSRREVRTPKVFLVDSGLFCSLVGATPSRLVTDGELGGKAIETFAYNEVLRQAGWSEQLLNGIYFYRDRDGREVDIVIEAADGRVVGIEVKSAARVSSSDSRGLRFLRDAIGDRFACGAVLYTGRGSLQLDDRIWALPLSALWL